MFKSDGNVIHFAAPKGTYRYAPASVSRYGWGHLELSWVRTLYARVLADLVWLASDIATAKLQLLLGGNLSR